MVSKKDREAAYAALPAEGRQKALVAAWNHAYMWAVAVQSHADRILQGLHTMTTVEQMGEAASLTVAVRNVLRAGEMAHLLAEGDQAVKMKQAISEFKTVLPDIAARDVLEHFDEYEIGIGNAQEIQKKIGRSITDYRLWYKKSVGSYVFHVGPLRMDVAVARDAAAQLAAAIALVEPPVDQPAPGARKCTHIRYVGPGEADDLHVAHGRADLAPGQVVPWPGVWPGRVDRTQADPIRAGGVYVVDGFQDHGDLVYAVARWEPTPAARAIPPTA